MGVVNNGDVLRVAAKMTCVSGDVQNVYHYRFTGTNGADALTVLGDIAEGLEVAYGEIQPALHSSLTFDSIDGYNVTRDEPMGTVDWPDLTVGGASGQPLPPQVSALCLFGTGTARSQGRKFLPPMTESETDGNGAITLGTLGSILGYAETLLDLITVAHGYVQAGNWNQALARFAPWVTAQAVDHFRTQRRRVSGRGT